MAKIRIYSLLDEHGQDVISLCLMHIKTKQYTQLKKGEVEKKCMDKIVALLHYVNMQTLQTDGVYCKTLVGNIVELRIPLPRSKYLLRIIACTWRWSCLLLTWWLIKPERYDDAGQTQSVLLEYDQQIEYAKQCREDFTHRQLLAYTDLTDLFFPHSSHAHAPNNTPAKKPGQNEVY